jgi:hypothetical protein
VNHRWAARILVVALHAALLAALWLHRPRGLAPDPARHATTVRLILPQLRLPPPANAPQRPAPSLTAPPVIAPQPVAIDTPAAPDVAPDVATAAPPTIHSTPAPAEPPRTTLRLTLPPGYAASSAAARNPALDDPRSNTPRLTLEDRIADATGGAGAWVEEKTSENRSQAVGALGEHRSVMRRGDTCVEIFRSRISDTDPFNSSVAPRAGRMMGKPYKCR